MAAPETQKHTPNPRKYVPFNETSDKLGAIGNPEMRAFLISYVCSYVVGFLVIFWNNSITIVFVKKYSSSMWSEKQSNGFYHCASSIGWTAPQTFA